MEPSPAYALIQLAALSRGGLVSLALDTRGDDLILTALYGDKSTDAVKLGKLTDEGIAAKVPSVLFDSFEDILDDHAWPTSTARINAVMDAIEWVMNDDHPAKERVVRMTA